MGKSPKSSDNSQEIDFFDVQRVRQLVELMNEYNLAEVDLLNGEMRIQLLRNVPPAFVPDSFAVHSSLRQPVSPPIQQASVTQATNYDDTNMVFIKSPMVGTFYAAQNPNSQAFVKVGDTVGPETTVCILEAMKVFNEIQAECSGRIVAVLAKNGDPVDYGKPLFKIDPRG